jgi:cytochrome c553
MCRACLVGRRDNPGIIMAIAAAIFPVTARAWCMATVLVAGVACAQDVDPQIAQRLAACTACHGVGGNSTDPQYPVLAGQTMRYIYLQLKDYKEGRRKNPLMDALVADLTRDDMLALGTYFSKQRVLPTKFKPDEAKAKLGKAKADEVLCTMCHLGGFVGQNEVPRTAGQHYEYVLKQLQDFKARRRTNDAGTMTSVSNILTDADIENLAHYIAGL